jgi:general secretion pathway protein A
VKWLRENLRSVQGLPPAAATSSVYDDELTRLVMDFQRRHRLNADGVAGVQTQIVLDTVLNPSSSPTLVGTAGQVGG